MSKRIINFYKSIEMKYILAIMFLGIVSCRNNSNRIMLFNNLVAEGNISRDTVFNGEIKFFNPQNHILVSKANYLNGILNGEKIEYYPNGKIAIDMVYEFGKKNGRVRFFNNNGEKKREEYYYYDLRVGYFISYIHNKISNYTFYSLDSYTLMDINYSDTISSNILDQQKAFFYLIIDNFQDCNIDSTDSTRGNMLYTPNPPIYNFRYSLVQITNDYKVKSVIENFSQDKCWSYFTLPKLKVDSLKYAIQLLLYDPNKKKDLKMYKVINGW